MAIELITGRAGTPHVDSADVGALNAAMFGGGVYVVEGCEATLTDANHVRVSAGELLCEGRHVRITGSGETLAIDNGLSGYNRNDIVAIRYERNSSDIETCSLVVVKGNQDTGAAQDPPMPSSGKLLDGASSVYWPLYRIAINGLTPQTPKMLASGNPVITMRDVLQIANGGTGATSATAALANLGVNDHIVTEGTTNGWTWVKYANGNAILAKKGDSHPIASRETWGSVYMSNTVEAFLPFNIKSYSGIFYSCDQAAGAYTYATGETWLNYKFFAGHELQGYTLSADILVFGRWK